MFEDWTIQTKFGHQIFGRTDFSGSKPSDKCFVTVHGYCGRMYERIHVEACEYFVQKGYDVVRFDLQSQNHKLRDATLQTHAAYLNSVLQEKCASYENLYLSGHSYGGPTIMIAQPHRANAICLWDPSFNLPALWKVMECEDHKDFVLLNFGGNEVVAGADMAKEGRSRYGTDECLKLSESLQVPIKVISAEDSEEMKVYEIDCKTWNNAGHTDNCRVVIDGSDHEFFNENTMQQVFEETLDWFETY